jgi:hypothetical protein
MHGPVPGDGGTAWGGGIGLAVEVVEELDELGREGVLHHHGSGTRTVAV